MRNALKLLRTISRNFISSLGKLMQFFFTLSIHIYIFKTSLYEHSKQLTDVLSKSWTISYDFWDSIAHCQVFKFSSVEFQGMDCYQPSSRQPPAPSITIPSAPGPRPPLRTTPHSAPSPSRTSPPAQARTESDSQPIYHSPTSSPRQSVSLQFQIEKSN